MTLQEINDRIRGRLTDDTGQARSDSKGCRYRTLEGLACAIGCLISDKHYDPKMEGSVVSMLRTVEEKWVKFEGDESIMGSPHTVLATALNNSEIPATPASWETLKLWQRRHDEDKNWRETQYIGSLSDPLDSLGLK
jgi:hypothetical protein